MVVAEYAPATSVRERNKHMFPVLFSMSDLDYIFYGLNLDKNYNNPLKLQTNTL